MPILPTDSACDVSVLLIGAGTCGLGAAFTAKKNGGKIARSYSRRRPKPPKGVHEATAMAWDLAA